MALLSPAEDPVVSVIIPARDAEVDIVRAIEAVLAQHLPEGFEVIVVDDGSRDRTSELVRERFGDRVRLIRNERSVGAGAARNRGVAAGRGTVLAFTDADCFPTPGWLQAGCAALEGADVVQGRVVPEPGTPRSPFDRSLVVEGDAGFYQTANLFVRRQTFERVGGFIDWALRARDPGYWRADRRRGRATRTPIGEDTLFGWRARRKGARVLYAADAVVHHAVVPGTLRDAIADRWHWTRDMPGLVRQVPELRMTVMERHWFFASWSAKFDLAAVALLLALRSRRPGWLLLLMPYIRRLWHEASAYRASGGSKLARIRMGLLYALGAPAVDAATLAGFITGSIEWRCLVL